MSKMKKINDEKHQQKDRKLLPRRNVLREKSEDGVLAWRPVMPSMTTIVGAHKTKHPQQSF